MKAIVVLVGLMLQALAVPTTNLIPQASNQFANKLYQIVAKEPGNVLICPISLHVALALVHQGAGGNTATELGSVLGFSGENAEVKESYKSMLTSIKDDTLKIATKLFPAEGYQLNNDFVTVAQTYFLSGVENVDYAKPEAAAATINKYVEDHTNNKIHDLISADSLSDLTKLVVVNAVHFNANWKQVFTSGYDDFFKVSPTEKVSAKFMFQTDYFDYKEDAALDAKILKMDYEGGKYSMIFILPNKEDGLPAVETKLISGNIESILKDLKQTKVEVTIPKFTIEKTMKLKQPLIDLGVKDVFSSRANLRGITNGDNLFVTDVIQKTYINVHENGTEAAAATGLPMVLMSLDLSKRYFVAKYPFYFILISSDPDYILFHGRLSTVTAH